jgi:hypothetical protein
VPADLSAPIPAARAYRDDPRPLDLDECPGLLQRSADVPDPRDHRGRQHSLVGVLAVAAAAVMAGAWSVTAIDKSYSPRAGWLAFLRGLLVRRPSGVRFVIPGPGRAGRFRPASAACGAGFTRLATRDSSGSGSDHLTISLF